MTRKDSEKETDRPHYYSQFWLDVAAGRTVIGAAKVEDETDLVEDETDMSEPKLEPTPLRRGGRNHAPAANDGYKSTRAQTVIEPAFVPEEIQEPEDNEFDVADDVVDLELPDNVLDDMEEEIIVPEAVIMPDEEETEEAEEELYFDDELEEEDEDEDEDEDGWSSRGRKKPKPGRQVKTPKPSKKPRREPRRGF
jgi:hypothetical protein